MRTIQMIAWTALATACQMGGEPLPLEDLSPALASVHCARTFECYDAAERYDQLGVELADEQACNSYITRALFDALAPVTGAVHAGRYRYDGEAATRCLSDIANATCAALRIGLDYATRACEPAFECISSDCEL